jgi:hypothetical protein
MTKNKADLIKEYLSKVKSANKGNLTLPESFPYKGKDLLEIYNFTFYRLTEKIKIGFILIVSPSLTKRGIRVSS